ncbi:protein disulfide-isomerase A4-like [Rhopilema esculentum]|uniref:protein disulfide-isomerase A4-like n=1 Tax=Rhopilema esculentum TaxID=499914 RepID=UPI0031DDA37F|eukprot:gene14428-5484_t
MWLFKAVLLTLFISSLFCEDENVVNDPATEKEESDIAEDTPSSESEESSEVKEENGVLVLTTGNFDDVINKHNVILVEFYAPWCGHCKTLAPKYEKAAQRMKNESPPVPFAKVDATVESDLGSRFEVQGYPTLKIFRKGQAYDYDGPREEDGIVNYMKEQSDPNWKPPPEEVITLTKDNFAEVTSREDLMLVEFYTPWCGHCKRLAPEYEKAAKVLKNREQPILLAKVDATQEGELAKQYGVTGYPTLKVFRKGKHSEYKGGRDQTGIISYMEGQVGPSSKLKPTLREVKEFMKQAIDDFVVLGVFSDENDPLYTTYLETNNDLRDDYAFGHTFDGQAKKHFSIKESSIIIIHPSHLTSKYEPKYQIFKDSKGTQADIQNFYEKHSAPLVGHIQSHTEKRFSKRPLVVVYYDVNFDHDYASMTQYWRNKVVEVAHSYPDIQFAVADEESYAEKLKELGLAESGEDVNVGFFDKKGLKYAMDDEFSEDDLKEFIDSCLKGDVKPILKSAPEPKKNDGPVKVVVGNTFDKIVMDESKDVLIEFYAPWCGHCKSLDPIYKKLGQKYKSDKNLVIAKMDATANDAPPEFKVEGFPTIYFAPPGKKTDPIRFDGDRTVEGFSKFLEERAVASFKKGKDEL